MSFTTDGLIEQVQELERERDDLREQVARLEKERAELRQRNASLMADREFWMDAASAFREKRSRLRAALEKYGAHLHPCDGNYMYAVCSCGLEEALKGAE